MSINPDMRLFPDFDDNLRQAMRQETELFFESVLREDRSVLDLIKADYTYLNERLAKHYGIPHVYGSRFRRVSLDERSQRGGLLAPREHSGGDFVRDPHFARDSRPLGAQEPGRRATSSAAAQCAGAQGQYRLEHAFGARAAEAASRERGLRQLPSTDGSGGLCAGELRRGGPLAGIRGWQADRRLWRTSSTAANSLALPGLEQALLDRPELFVRTLTEKLLTFALGRGVEYYDAPAIRKIVAAARDDNYRFSQVDHGHCPKHAVSDEDVAMIIKKIALPRRTFLRGTGAALALPLLDAMVPALTALADTPANPARLRRLGFVYMPMGCDVTRWTPPGGTRSMNCRHRSARSRR